MAGIYIHFPYCKHKCSYCNFFSVGSSKLRDGIVNAIRKELVMQKHYLENEMVSTLYLGGGTPSLLSDNEINCLTETIYSNFGVEENPEITLEANPDDLDTGYVQRLKNTLINRVSIGVQSFRDEDLFFLDRRHTASQSESGVKRLQDMGFEDINVDLIYGIPTLSHSAWQANVLKAVSLQVPHISAYALTVEEQTPLHVAIRKGTSPDVIESEQAEQFEILSDLLQAAGYHHYEVSNFALPGRYSRHNTAYWQGMKYLGVGPSAHSYNGDTRQWNVAGLQDYITGLKNGRLPCEKEVLTGEQKFNEYVMLSLRTMWGCDLNWISNRFGDEWKEQLLREISIFVANGLAFREENLLKLTGEGLFRADGIAASLFRV